MRAIRLAKKNVVLRTVELLDAEFILSLRLNNDLNRYLSDVENNLQNQIDWIMNYKIRENKKEEYYFIIEDKRTTKFGTLRIYDIQNKECTWGSFILKPDRPSNFSYQSASLSFEFAFETLGMNQINLDVNNSNHRAIHVYKKLGFEETHRDKKNIYMKLTEEKYRKSVEV